jgi:hypothetical protein
VHVELEFDPRVEGEQLTEVSVRMPGIWSPTVAVMLWLPSVAVTTAVGMVELVNVPVVAENVALLCPASTVALDGTLRPELLLCTETVVLEVTVWFTETVHVVEAFWPMLEGAQFTEVSVVAAGIWSVTVAVRLWLPSVAVTTAVGVLELVSVPVVAENMTLLCPASTVALDGTLRPELLLCTETVVLEITAWFTETVHVVEAFWPMLEGAQFTEVSVVTPGTWSVMVVVGLWLPSVAVSTADGVMELVRVPVVAENVALLCPDNTVTLEATLSAALLLLRETVVLAVADSFKETVHVAVAFEPRDDGVHPTVVNATGGLSVKLAVFAAAPVPAVTMAV